MFKWPHRNEIERQHARTDWDTCHNGSCDTLNGIGGGGEVGIGGNSESGLRNKETEIYEQLKRQKNREN